MTATLPDWMTTTGPIDFYDADAPAADPYLRDAAGRFAPHPAERPGTAARYYPVPAPKCVHGHFARWAARNCRRCAGLR